MAKKKTGAKRQPRGESRPRGESGWKRFFHFIWLPPVRRLILAVIMMFKYKPPVQLLILLGQQLFFQELIQAVQ